MSEPKGKKVYYQGHEEQEAGALVRGRLYPVGDNGMMPMGAYPPFVQRMARRAGVELDEREEGGPRYQVMARWNGHAARAPRVGEWYFSGAIVSVYEAQKDFTSEYYIAELVLVRVEQVTRIEEIEVVK